MAENIVWPAVSPETHSGLVLLAQEDVGRALLGEAAATADVETCAVQTAPNMLPAVSRGTIQRGGAPHTSTNCTKPCPQDSPASLRR